MSVLMAILGILLIVLGGLCAITPMTTFMTTGYFVAICLIVGGVVGIINSFYFKFFGWHLIVGIIGIALGGYSLVHPIVPAITIGLLVALYFIEQGLDIIAMSRVERAFGK